LLRACRLDLAEHPLGRLVLVLEQLDRVHRALPRGLAASVMCVSVPVMPPSVRVAHIEKRPFAQK
jgi:hypothetical protein